MKYVYFVGCKDVDEVKTKYKSLVKQHHPDMTGGSHDKFVVLKAEYDHIMEGRSLFPIANLNMGTKGFGVNTTEEFEETFVTPKETVTHLSPEEILFQRATTFFNNIRKGDIIFDQIDEIVKEGKAERTSKLWIYQEVQKLDDLTLDHFKYLTFILKDAVSDAHLFFKKYQMSKVV